MVQHRRRFIEPEEMDAAARGCMGMLIPTLFMLLIYYLLYHAIRWALITLR